MPYPDWAAVRHDLTCALEELADGEFFIMGENIPSPGRCRGLFGRRAAPPATRYVQTLRVAEVFSAECVGATSLGGTWDMDPDTIEQLRSRGWLTPQESEAQYANPTPNFDLYVELTEARQLSAVMVASLALLGALPPQLVLQPPGGAAQLVG